jgi:multiple sugar transport system substrate-binding protein
MIRSTSKVVAGCLACLMVVLLFGSCSRKSSAAGGKKSTVNVMWTAGMNQGNVIRKVIEEKFVVEHPNITVVFSEVPQNEINNKALLEATGKTGAYDVLMQNLHVPALANINALEPLDTYIKRDSFPIEKMIDNGVTYKGQVWGIPVRGDVRVLHYNADLFKAAGLDPDKPPKTLAEYEQYATTLTKNGKYGQVRNPNNVDNFTSLLFQFGGEFINSNFEPVYNSDAGVKALQYMIDELKRGVVDPQSISLDYSSEMALYFSGDAAMFDSWPARYIDSGMPEKSKIVGSNRVAALPGAASLVSGWHMVMFNTTKDKDAAWEFMKFVADPVNQKEVILRGGDCNPTHLDVLNDAELQAKYEVLRAVSDSFSKTKIYALSTQYETVRNHINDEMPKAFLGAKTAKQALDDAAKLSRQALIDAGELKG